MSGQEEQATHFFNWDGGAAGRKKRKNKIGTPSNTYTHTHAKRTTLTEERGPESVVTACLLPALQGWPDYAPGDSR